MVRQSADPVVVPPGTCPMGAAAVTWKEATAALAEAASGVPELFAQVRDPKAHAVGIWNVEELATHMSHAWAAMPNLARRDVDALRAQLPVMADMPLGTDSGAMLPQLDLLAAATIAAVKADPERDLGVLGERIRTGVQSFCREFDGDADPSFRPWIADGILAPPTLFACHTLFETLMHSDDLARAAGLRHKMADRHAEIALRGFILPMLVNLTRGQPGPKLTIDLRLAGACRLSVVYTGRGVAIEPPGSRPADSHLWVRPSALLLFMWRRRSLASIVATRQSFVWGRRPWTAFEPLKAVPSV